MTLEEIENLKLRIDKHLDTLHAQELNASIISNALAVLITRDAGQDLIDTWIKTVNNELNVIIEALEEIEEQFS